MKEYIYLGSAPCNEKCLGVGDENYSSLINEECNRYITLITNHFFKSFKRYPYCKLRIKSENHDFGTYKEVVVEFYSNNEEAMNDAFWIEENSPLEWEND